AVWSCPGAPRRSADVPHPRSEATGFQSSGQKRTTAPFGAVAGLLQHLDGSEALLVLHVHEAAHVEATVVRVLAAGRGEHDRTVVVAHVVGADGHGGVPRGIPAELDVVEGVRTGATKRRGLTVLVAVRIIARPA